MPQVTKKVISEMCSATREMLLNAAPRKIVMSGPSGYLGRHVLEYILEIHRLRQAHDLDPGEVTLLSSRPGTLMHRLAGTYGKAKMKTIKASRVDYYTQHDVMTWRDQLGSLGMEGKGAVFINLAALAGPVAGNVDTMMDVNYSAAVAAAKACEMLEFSQFMQSSTQATNAERAGQVLYSRAKAMTDFSLASMRDLNVTILVMGLIYNKTDGMVGQRSDNSINLIDLALLPLTPIMGNGLAPLQPLEIHDAAFRMAYMALVDAKHRPLQYEISSRIFDGVCKPCLNTGLRIYDAVGPEEMTITEMMQKFAAYQGNKHFRPVHIDYHNMERILNVKSLGNLNRQFVSLLRSEQDTEDPIVGRPDVWASILPGKDGKLLTLDEAFQSNVSAGQDATIKRDFPYRFVVKHIMDNPKVIVPGIALSNEILHALFTKGIGKV